MNIHPPSPNCTIWQQATVPMHCLYTVILHIWLTYGLSTVNIYIYEAFLRNEMLSLPRLTCWERGGKYCEKNPLSSTKRCSVGNIKPDIPYSVGKTCHKHISQHPSLRSRKSVTMCMENSANPEWISVEMLRISMSLEMQNHANYSLGNSKKSEKFT